MSVTTDAEYTLLVLDRGGSLGPLSQLALRWLAKIPHRVDVVRVPEQRRYAHPVTRSTGFYLFPQLLYRGQLLGSLEVIEEWCRTLTRPSTARSSWSRRWPGARRRPVWSVDNDRQRFTTACADGALEFWSGDLGTVERIRLADTWLTTVRTLSDGKFAVGSSSGSVYVVNTGAAPVQVISAAHDGWVNALAVDRVSGVVITGGNDHRIRVWSADDWSLIQELKIPPSWVNAIAARNGLFYAALSSGEIVGGPVTKTPRKLNLVPVGRCLNSVDVDDDGEVVAAGFDSSPAIVDPSRNAVTFLGGGAHRGGVWGVRHSATGSVVTVGGDRTLRSWSSDRRTCRVLHRAHSPLIALTLTRSAGEQQAVAVPRGQRPVLVSLEREEVLQ